MTQYIFVGLLGLGAFLIWFDGKEKPKKEKRSSKKQRKAKTDIANWFEAVVSTTKSSRGNGGDSCK